MSSSRREPCLDTALDDFISKRQRSENYKNIDSFRLLTVKNTTVIAKCKFTVESTMSNLFYVRRDINYYNISTRRLSSTWRNWLTSAIPRPVNEMFTLFWCTERNFNYTWRANWNWHSCSVDMWQCIDSHDGREDYSIGRNYGDYTVRCTTTIVYVSIKYWNSY